VIKQLAESDDWRLYLPVYGKEPVL
jgi:hypothetical protein